MSIPPTVSIIDPGGGGGAVAAATLEGGVVKSVSLSSSGSGYSHQTLILFLPDPNDLDPAPIDLTDPVPSNGDTNETPSDFSLEFYDDFLAGIPDNTPIGTDIGILSVLSQPIVSQISTGFTHSLFVKSDGSLWGAGANRDGQLSPAFDNQNTPVQLIDSGVVGSSGGSGHSLALKDDGSLWGAGWNGALGVDSNTTQYEFVKVIATDVSSIQAGGAHSLFLMTGGSLWAMGDNYAGQLGDGTNLNRNSPVQILDSGVSKISAGGSHSLILKTDGSLWAMGYNSEGQLGDGTNINRNSPVQILDSGVKDISAGQSHSLIIKTDGSLWAMGANNSGQLGDGTNSNRNSPIQVIEHSVEWISAGAWHSLFVMTDGSLWSMGENLPGSLGDGTNTNRNSPIQVIDSGVERIAAGGSHSLIVKSDGSVWATGHNQDGALGDGTNVAKKSFVKIIDAPVYSLSDNASYPDNSSFVISANKIATNENLDAEIKTDYRVELVADYGGNMVTSEYNIKIVKHNNPPLLSGISSQAMAVDGSLSVEILATDSDGDSLLFAAIPGNENLSATLSENILNITALNGWVGKESIVVYVGDGNGGEDSVSFSIEVIDIELSDYNLIENNTSGLTGWFLSYRPKLNISNGVGLKLWEFETNSPITASPTIGHDGMVYIPSEDSFLYALEPESGILKWKFETGQRIENTPAISKNNYIYLSAWDKYVYKINAVEGS